MPTQKRISDHDKACRRLSTDARRSPRPRWPLHATQTAAWNGQQPDDVAAPQRLPAHRRRAAHPRLVSRATSWRSTPGMLGLRTQLTTTSRMVRLARCTCACHRIDGGGGQATTTFISPSNRTRENYLQSAAIPSPPSNALKHHKVLEIFLSIG
jgi:hypothetical protein